MYAARVVGTVVCTSKEEKLTGLKMLVVQPVNVLNMINDGKCAVAIDAVGAGHNEMKENSHMKNLKRNRKQPLPR